MRGRRVAPANCEMLDWAFRRTGSLRFIGRCFLGESLKRGEASSDMDARDITIRRDGAGQKSCDVGRLGQSSSEGFRRWLSA